MFIFLAVVAAFTALLIIVERGWDKEDVIACSKLKEQAAKLAPYSEKNPGGFYITPNEKEMCDYWKIETGAVVKTN